MHTYVLRISIAVTSNEGAMARQLVCLNNSVSKHRAKTSWRILWTWPQGWAILITWCVLVLKSVSRENFNASIYYHSYTHFVIKVHKEDISSTPYRVGEIFDDLDDRYWCTSKLMTFVIDIPLFKTRKPVDRPIPFMNAMLNKACHTKAMVRYGLFLNVAETKGCWKSIYNFRLRCCPCSTWWGWSGCRKLRNAATKISVLYT